LRSSCRLDLVQNSFDLGRCDECFIQRVTGVIALPTFQIDMSAFDSGKNQERCPLLRQTLAKFGSADLAGNKRVITPANQKIISETIL